jgi:hypothetical protein
MAEAVGSESSWRESWEMRADRCQASVEWRWMGVELDYPLEYVLELCFCSLFILVGFGGDVAHGGILGIGVEQGICLESVSWLLKDRLL